MASSFREATSIVAASPYTYTAEFTDPWCIGTVPHGGYVTSIFQRVAKLHFETTLKSQNQPHTITLHLEFVRRTFVGRAVFSVRHVKLGRQLSTIYISLAQSLEGESPRDAVLGFVTQGDLCTETGVSFHTGWNLHPTPKPADTSKFDADQDPYWKLDPDERFANFRKAHKRVQRFVPRHKHEDLSFSDEWLRLASPECSHTGDVSSTRFTSEALGFVVDMFPQLIESYLEASRADDPKTSQRNEQENSSSASANYWYPTLSLSLDIKKRLPPEGVEWLFVRVRAKAIQNGRYDLEVVVLDDSSNLICLSHHVVLAVEVNRNLAKRGKAGKRSGRL